MKKTIFAFAALAMTLAMTSCGGGNKNAEAPAAEEQASAQAAGKEYDCTASGVTVVVPEGVVTEEEDITKITSEDGMFTVTLVPFNLAETSQDEMSEGVAKLAQAGKIDVTKLTAQDLKTSNMNGQYYADNYDNGGWAATGILTSEDESTSVFFGIVAGPDYVDAAKAAMNSIKAK